MTLKELAQLYILQKDYLTHRTEQYILRFKEVYERHLQQIEYTAADCMAPPLFKNQPDIPFVLLKPKSVTPEQPAPLIVHTHGGYNAYFQRDLPHAEILFFLSRGFVVVCPNYRGSTDYPFHDDNRANWLAWIEKSKGKFHIYGAEDVYTVAKFMQSMPFIQRNQTLLHGLSAGSDINAHVLTGITSGRFESLFAGAHLCAAPNFPLSSEMPTDIPLLITHSRADDRAPYRNAKIFMEKLLLKQLSIELGGIAPNKIQTFVARNGNHCMIDPQLTTEDISSDSYRELLQYLTHQIDFFMNCINGVNYKTVDTYDQFKALVSEDITTENISEEILQRVHAYRYVKENITINEDDGTSHQDNQSFTNDITHHGATNALLRLTLGEQYTGECSVDLRNFLQQHFKPYDRDKKIIRDDVGQKMLTDRQFIQQIETAMKVEEKFLSEHPSHMTLIHAADLSGLQLYRFINLWKNILQGKKLTALPIIEEMRLYDFVRNSYSSINELLTMMRGKEETKKLNFRTGFADRAIACNPSLISNAFSTSACSLWWYFGEIEDRKAPIIEIIQSLLAALGIYSEERLVRYQSLFEAEKQQLEGKPQTLLQQIFLPYELAEKSAYMCLIWGEEFKANEMKLHSPHIIRELIQSPESFEARLKAAKDAIPNYDDCPNFGDTANGFHYADTLQTRYLPQQDSSIVTFSYFRQPELHRLFTEKLSQLIKEDFADYLAIGTVLPDYALADADATKKKIYSHSSLRFYQPKPQIGDHILFMLQRELWNGLVENPDKEKYGKILNADRETKIKIQRELLKSKANNNKSKSYLFTLSKNLAGYTYYDIAKEVLDEHFSSEKIGENKTHAAVMWLLNQYSIPGYNEPYLNCSFVDFTEHLNLFLLKLGYFVQNLNPERHTFLDNTAEYPTLGLSFEFFGFMMFFYELHETIKHNNVQTISKTT